MSPSVDGPGEPLSRGSAGSGDAPDSGDAAGLGASGGGGADEADSGGGTGSGDAAGSGDAPDRPPVWLAEPAEALRVRRAGGPSVAAWLAEPAA
ncbi:hypothetical protein ABZS54_24455, partial [Embleya sp. NPDC005575]